MVSRRTDELLLATFTASFEREVEADEAVWRTMPFFGALIAIAVAVLPPVYRSVATIDVLGWRAAAYVFFAGSLLSFAVAAVWFWQVVRIRQYRYPASDEKILGHVEKLSTFYDGKRLMSAGRDKAVRDDLRKFLIREFAESTTNNRVHNNAKIGARSKVLLFSMSGLLFAFGCEATILLFETMSSV